MVLTQLLSNHVDIRWSRESWSPFSFPSTCSSYCHCLFCLAVLYLAHIACLVAPLKSTIKSLFEIIIAYLRKLNRVYSFLLIILVGLLSRVALCCRELDSVNKNACRILVSGLNCTDCH